MNTGKPTPEEGYQPKYLGKPGATWEGLDSIPWPYTPGTVVKLTAVDVTTFCPFTDHPDHYQVVIEYAPDVRVLESKSLKLYLHALRDARETAETLSRRILRVIQSEIRPRRMSVTVTQASRGGITIEARTETLSPRILRVIQSEIRPRRMSVTVTQASRGGITIEARTDGSQER